MNLAEEFDKLIAKLEPPPGFAEAAAAAYARLAKEAVAPGLEIGTRVPLFCLPDARGDQVCLKELLERGPVVISFFRGDWCPFCNLELQALHEALPEIRAAGASVLAISPQAPDHARALTARYGLDYAVLSDADQEVIQAYQLQFSLPEELRQRYVEQLGIDMAQQNADGSWCLPVPATYVVDQAGVIRARHVSMDITSRMEPDDAAGSIDAFNYFESVFRNAPLAISILGREGTVVDHNAALNRLLALPLGGSYLGADGHGQFDASDPRAARLIDDVLAQRRTYGTEKHIRTTPVSGEPGDGRVVNLSVSQLEVRDRLLGAVCIYDDVTDKVQQRDELERALRELRQAQTRLVQAEKMASLGQLVAGIAHELNSPVGALSSAADATLRGVEKLEAGAAADSAAATPALARTLRSMRNSGAVLVEAAARISEVVKGLESFVRLDGSAIQQSDLHQMLEGTLALLRHETRDRIEVVRAYGELPQVQCRPDQLNQVLMNVLRNAIGAIDGRGTIRISSSADEANVQLRIADSGVGIPADQLQRIFEPGYTTKHGVQVGTGLGLSICYNVMLDHEGSIEVASEEGRGAEVTLTLPIRMRNQTGPLPLLRDLAI